MTTHSQSRFRTQRVDPELLLRARQMRHEPAPAEQKLWWCLRDRRLNGFKFRRQYSVRSYVADFYCPEAKLIVELDGESHHGRERYDADRTRELREEGFRVVRFVNTDVFENLDRVLEAILSECEAAGVVREEAPHPNPLP
jgi:very-short-patch-repair endonuclease